MKIRDPLRAEWTLARLGGTVEPVIVTTAERELVLEPAPQTGTTDTRWALCEHIVRLHNDKLALQARLPGRRH
jgi:hypothetical protein